MLKGRYRNTEGAAVTSTALCSSFLVPAWLGPPSRMAGQKVAYTPVMRTLALAFGAPTLNRRGSGQ